MLLGTYSDHIAIEEGIRKEFFSKIQDAINNHGGSITVYDTIDLQLARKPGDAPFSVSISETSAASL